jgi:hypothetical protein
VIILFVLLWQHEQDFKASRVAGAHSVMVELKIGKEKKIRRQK